MIGSKGYSFILKMPVPSRCFVLLRKINIVAADKTIPKESRKMLKLKIVSKSFDQKMINTQSAVNTDNETVNTPVAVFVFLNTGGNILSSLMAYITLGLLINK